MTLDLDGCAPREGCPGRGVVEALEAAAVEHGAVLAYRAASGSPDSEHRAYAVPEGTRDQFRAAVAGVRDRFGADGIGRRWALEDRTAGAALSTRERRGRGLRLPLSSSVKHEGGPVVWPLDADGLPVLDLHQCIRMVREARTAAGLPAAPTAPGTALEDARHPQPRMQSSARQARTRRDLPPTVARWSPEVRDTLQTVHPHGYRSDGALEALRLVVRKCGVEWSAVRDVVLAAPVFRKFARRGEEAARRWWEATAARYVEHLREVQPEASREDGEVVEAWLASSWQVLRAGYGLERAARAYRGLVVIGQRVMLDGRGLEARRVACRDLVIYGAASGAMTAWRILQDLEEAGVLQRASTFTMRDPLEAVRWSVPRDTVRAVTCGWHEVIQVVHTHAPLPALHTALTLDSCTWMRATVWTAWLHLLGGPATAASLAELLGGSSRAVRGWLSELSAAGLICEEAGVWSAVSSADAGDAAGAGEALEVLEDARARVEVERGLWRAAVLLEVSPEGVSATVCSAVQFNPAGASEDAGEEAAVWSVYACQMRLSLDGVQMRARSWTGSVRWSDPPPGAVRDGPLVCAGASPGDYPVMVSRRRANRPRRGAVELEASGEAS